MSPTSAKVYVWDCVCEREIDYLHGEIGDVTTGKVSSENFNEDQHDVTTFYFHSLVPHSLVVVESLIQVRIWTC
jgi:hypothetical protein